MPTVRSQRQSLLGSQLVSIRTDCSPSGVRALLAGTGLEAAKLHARWRSAACAAMFFFGPALANHRRCADMVRLTCRLLIMQTLWCSRLLDVICYRLKPRWLSLRRSLSAVRDHGFTDNLSVSSIDAYSRVGRGQQLGAGRARRPACHDAHSHRSQAVSDSGIALAYPYPLFR